MSVQTLYFTKNAEWSNVTNNVQMLHLRESALTLNFKLHKESIQSSDLQLR
jgi:hypothetical protein